MSRDRQRLGRAGEDLACRELRRRGYDILARRYRTRAGEIDVVARQGGVTVFVEVKARRSARCGLPVDAVTLAKRRQVAAMAAEYLARTAAPESACRFDVVAVMLEEDAAPCIEVLTNAFDVGG